MVSSTIILVFCLVTFAVIHSFLASLPFKRFIMQILGSRVETLFRPVYSLIALITILPLIYLLYKNPGPIFYIVPSPWRWFMVGGQLIGAIIGARGLMDAPHRFKISGQLSAPNTPEAGSLDIRGIYRWIRDPFLLSGLIIIWLTPFMTFNLLIIYILSTIYIYLGSLHVEKRLLSRFGDEYREYQKKVHRIIPHFGGDY
ncbi:protein-S-isoprenylcysteine methyltransferase [Methanococcoides methylutens]|uniref:Protein-S-isoprenylcysteine methyltransferase n=1 Tax=Methanococcoides methylutens TaxID=2226 RepID=A0A099T4H0_METMT|nr:isoprenylcysteine carboxylmethyltransferase family protein [Methanococcoides methylutens]KGK99754.1 protein-S-isoprenylcysteine methyltransferase [Methanococcoides methylutens]